jgi:Flp pilus assembly protein TadD/SAM-dependent methyltransferase
MASEWDRLYEEARRLHQQDRLDDALTLYTKVIAGNPGHGGAMHMLGLIAYQIGRTDTAVDLLAQAAVLDPLVGAVHSNLGLALVARGRMTAAEGSFRRALLLSPQAETHASLGQLLLQQGKLEEAVTSFRAALARDPSLADAEAGLGESLWKLGRARDAEAAYEKAARLAPASDILANLALLAFARGDATAALARIGQALAAGETARARAVFTTIVARLRWDRDDPPMRTLLARALEEGWAHSDLLLPPAADLVKLRLRAGNAIETDTLLLLMLTSAPIADAELEALLTALRRQLLEQPQSRDLHFTAALAQQCFLTGYAFVEEAGERAKAEALAVEISQAMAADDPVPALSLLAVACYLPLSSLKGADGLLRRGWPEPLEPLLRQQLEEPAEEKRLAAALPLFAAIDDETSRKVAADVEQNFHPRWVRPEMAETPITLAAWLGRRFPVFDAARLPLLPAMLFAGCGTGHQMLELVRRHPASSRLGVDLSRVALGYAARKAAETGLAVEFAQADILRLPEMKKRFAMIECGGVLQQMADPLAGASALTACLEPGGVMRLLLPSQAGRAPLTAARNWVAERGFTRGDVRAARANLLAEQPEAARPFLATADFHDLDACRELLFPVVEHPLGLDAIAAFLAENGLTFLGFETGEDVMGAYRARFPADATAADLANWTAFEAERPFTAMYQFWVQKA